MKEFRPSEDFVSRVMKNVHDLEGCLEVTPGLPERILASRLFRYAMSGGGVFVGIVLVPVTCM